ncbi:MAG: flagellar basal body rod protein FlgC [Ignavibacteriales bacterium]|nr:flagellar basal body rod protein FlgC [Ignavibacteriales bacterium]
MKIDGMFSGLNISASGLSAQRKRMNAIASNVANAETTRTEDGGPYRRKIVLLHSKLQETFGSMMKNAGGRLTATDGAHFSEGEGESMQGGASAPAVDAAESFDSSPFRSVYDPSHPDADESGYVKMPNVNVVTEMVDMISASRSYEANVTAVNAAKTMAKDSLEI